jgi:hypothetical protein
MASELERTVLEVQDEINRAIQIYQKFNSPHEAIAVIREEYLELEHEIFHGNLQDARKEALQLAAMAILFANTNFELKNGHSNE